MMARALALLILAVSSAGAHASSLTLEDAANNLDPSVQSVSLCGNWSHNNVHGSFRVIYGWLWGHTEIYVQWLADPIWYAQGGEEERAVPLVVKTATFPEYDNYEAATGLGNVKCTKRNGQWAITADADNANDEDDATRRYELVIYLYDEPGKFKLVQNPKSGKRKAR